MSELQTDVAIVGAGVSGLALAFQLQQRGIDVHVLEAGPRVGGNVRSDRIDGYLCEWGPQGFLDNEPATLRLVDALGLRGELLRASDAANRRWVARAGALRELPMKPPQFLTSDILSLPGKLRVLLEWAQPARRATEDESVFDFAARRIGREAAAVLVDAMVTGIYAGDSSKLSLRSTFPRMYELERDHGGLFRAMRAMRRARKQAAKSAAANGGEKKDPATGPPNGGAPAKGSAFGPGGTLHSFTGGMQMLVDGLASRLGERVHLGWTVKSLQRDGRWRLTTADGATCVAQHVVFSSPAWSAAPLLHSVDDKLALELAAISSAPVAVVCLGYDAQAFAGQTPGFGFLCPGSSGMPLLGVLFESWIFDGRAPQGKFLARAMVGGARDRQAVQESDDVLVERVRRTLGALMGVDAQPEMQVVFRHTRGIPQYELGHGERLERIEARLRAHEGLHLIGYSYRGIAMNACIKSAEEFAPQLETVSR